MNEVHFDVGEIIFIWYNPAKNKGLSEEKWIRYL